MPMYNDNNSPFYHAAHKWYAFKQNIVVFYVFRCTVNGVFFLSLSLSALALSLSALDKTHTHTYTQILHMNRSNFLRIRTLRSSTASFTLWILCISGHQSYNASSKILYFNVMNVRCCTFFLNSACQFLFPLFVAFLLLSCQAVERRKKNGSRLYCVHMPLSCP